MIGPLREQCWTRLLRKLLLYTILKKWWQIREGIIGGSLTGDSTVLSLTLSTSFLIAVYCCQFDDRRIVSGGGDNLVVVWNAKTADIEAKCTGHTGDVVSKYI